MFRVLFLVVSLAALFPAVAVGQARVFTAVAPTIRTQIPGEPRTSIMAIINNGNEAATNCRAIRGSSSNGIDYDFFEIQIANDVVTNNGPLNTAFDIPAGATRYAAIAMNINQNFGSTGQILKITQHFVCDNSGVRGFVYLNQLQLVQLTGTPADVIASIITPSQDGVLRVASEGGVQRAAAAMVNIGSDGNPALVTVTPYYPNLSERRLGFANSGGPFELLVCETDATTGQCLSPPSATLDVMLGNTIKTFAIVLRDNMGFGARLFPSLSRVGLRVQDQSGNLVGESNIAYTVPAATPVAVGSPSPTTVSDYAGVYSVNAVGDDGRDWNGTQDIGSGYIIVEPSGGVWLFNDLIGARLDPNGPGESFWRSQFAFGQMQLGAVDGALQNVTIDFEGIGSFSDNTGVSAQATFTAVFSGRGAPNGYLFGGMTRSSIEPESPANTNWPTTINVRANMDVRTNETVSIPDLAGLFVDSNNLQTADNAGERFDVQQNGQFSGYFRRYGGQTLEVCAITGTITHPDPARHVLTVTATATPHNDNDCSFTGSITGVAALNQPGGFFVIEEGTNQQIEIQARELTFLFRNTGTGQFYSTNAFRREP